MAKLIVDISDISKDLITKEAKRKGITLKKLVLNALSEKYKLKISETGR